MKNKTINFWLNESVKALKNLNERMFLNMFKTDGELFSVIDKIYIERAEVQNKIKIWRELGIPSNNTDFYHLLEDIEDLLEDNK